MPIEGFTFGVLYCSWLPLPTGTFSSHFHFHSLLSHKNPVRGKQGRAVTPLYRSPHQGEVKCELAAGVHGKCGPELSIPSLLLRLSSSASPAVPLVTAVLMALQQDCGPAPVLHGAEQENFFWRVSPVKAMHWQVPHPLPVLGPHERRFMGSGRTFLVREQEKLASEGQCWAWNRLDDHLTFHSFLATQPIVLSLVTNLRTLRSSFTSFTPPRAPRGSPDSPKQQPSVQERDAYLTHAHFFCLVIITSKL